MKELLVLTFNEGGRDIKSRVYHETLTYIADNLSQAEVYQFVDNQRLLDYVAKHQFSSVVSTNDIPCETAYLLKGMGLVQILIGVSQDLLDISDIIIDPLVIKSKKYLVGLRYLLPSILTKIPVKDIAGIVDIDEGTLTEEVDHNEAEIELLEIVQLCRKLEWDSNFFETNVAYISCLRLTPNIERHIKKFIRKEKIDLVEYLCNCHDRESVITSENNGYSFVDMRLTFERILDDTVPSEQREGYKVRKSREDDIGRLREIATDIYKNSRYYFDLNFDRAKVIEFYANWVEKAVRGQFDDYAYALEHQETPVGFCTIKRMRKGAAAVNLFGICPGHIGGGVARYLLNASLQKLRDEEGIHYIEVVTQGRNYEAQRLYQRCGFITKSTELWYHKWFH